MASWSRGLRREIGRLAPQRDLGSPPQRARRRCTARRRGRGRTSPGPRPIRRSSPRRASPAREARGARAPPRVASSFDGLASHASTAPLGPHGAREDAGLVPAPRARVEHRLARPRPERERRELRPFFLDRPRALGPARQAPAACRRRARGWPAARARPGSNAGVRARPRAAARATRRARPRRSTRSATAGGSAPQRRNARAPSAVSARSSASRSHAGVDATIASARSVSPVASARAATLRSTAFANAATRVPRSRLARRRRPRSPRRTPARA